MGLAVAALAAVGFAISTSLQHHASDGVILDGAQRGHLACLVRQPWWVIGQIVALAAFALHVWALKIGLLVIVQPVVVSGIVLAVPVRAALERRLPRLRELGTVALTAAGLSLFLLFVHPSTAARGHAAGAAAAAAAGVGIVVAAAAARWAGRRVGLPSATGYGVASGVLFGLTAGLVKLAAVAAASAPGTGIAATVLAVLAAWPAWLVPLVGIAGVVLNQRAYRAGPLSASMPLLNIVDVVVAIVFGVVVFGEVPAHHVLDLVGQAAGIAFVLVGLRRLARAHVLDSEMVVTAEVADTAEAPAVTVSISTDPPYSRSTS